MTNYRLYDTHEEAQGVADRLRNIGLPARVEGDGLCRKDGHGRHYHASAVVVYVTDALLKKLRIEP